MLNYKQFVTRIKNFLIIKTNNFLYFVESIYLSKYLLDTKKMNLVFDIGYNMGAFSRALIKQKSNIKIIAIEANHKLIQNSYSHKNIKKFCFLMSNKKHLKQKFFVSNKFLGASTASEEYTKMSRLVTGTNKINHLFDETRLVQTNTLDNLIKKHGIPDLIKIDVEGYEEKVLSGLTIKTPKITFEWSEEMCDSLLKTIKHLQKIGFKKFGVVGYFVQKNSKVLHSLKADPFLIEPNYYTWNEIELEKIIDIGRKKSYGMIWAK